MLENIRKKYKKAVMKKCEEQKCTLKTNRLADCLILKGEKIHRKQKMADCIIFVRKNRIIIGIAELKSRTVHAKEIREKLKNSAMSVLSILGEKKDQTFYFLVLAKRWKSSETKVIQKTKLDIMGKKHLILTKKCGTDFSEILSKFE